MLNDLRIVEIGEGLAVQVCGLLLSELGADVLKIEPPGGDAGRGSAGFANWNRGKRSLELDLDSAQGLAALGDHLAGADVLVHRFTPARAKKLGLDDGVLAERFPHLVVCGITGSPRTHPDAERSDDELLVAARLGAMYENDGHRGGPIVGRYPAGHWSAAHLAAGGILTRLVMRLASGKGGPAHTSILQGLLAAMPMVWVRNSKGPMPNAPTYGNEARAPAFQLHKCKGGQWLQIIDPTQRFDYGLLPSMWDALADGIDIGTRDGLDQAFLRETVPTWLEQLREHDVACEQAAPLGEVLRHADARANGYVIEVDDPHFGRVYQPNSPYHADVPLPQGRPAPRLGEGGEKDWRPRSSLSALQSHSFSAAHPLEGVRVVDFGMFLAGPLGPSLMGDLGADVIKVEALSGDRLRFMHHLFQAGARSKRSLAVDLTRPEAQPILERLVHWGEIAHHNMRFKGADKLGLSEENLRRLNPDIGFAYVSAYGQRGNRRNWPGFDTIFTALAGWEFEHAGEGNRPITLRSGPSDMLTAHSCFVASLALLYLKRAGLPGRVLHSSMLGVITMVQGELLLRADGTLTDTYHLSSDQTGFSPYHRIFEATDGAWIAIAAHRDTEREALRGVLGCDEAGFAAAVMARSADELLATLEAAGIPCDAVMCDDAMHRFFDDPLTHELGLKSAVEQPTYGLIEQPGIFWDMGDVPIAITRACPDVGEHTDEIMAQLGFSDREIDAFREKRIIA
jgi:crotonobetainyl-CoA:carnitine CoA-transferase CaiB-like acyl-CoA transferase